MTEKKYRVHDFVKFDYSQIKEYIGEEYTDRPLRNDEIVDLLNKLSDENEQLKNEVINLEVELDTHKHPLWSTREAERIINELKKENEQLKKELTQKTKWIRRSLESVRPIIKNGKQEIEKTNSTTLETLYNTLGDIPISYNDFEIMFCVGTKAYPVDELFINENKMVIALYKGGDVDD